jgi:CDP-diglyceride synthetase
LFGQVLVKLSPDNSSASARLERLNDFNIVFSNAEFINLLFGYGPGAYKSLEINSIVSLYPTIILEVGLLGMGLFVLFFMVIFIKILKIKNEFKWFLMCAFFSSVLHFFIISNYWYPWFWFLCALVVVWSNYEFKYNLRVIPVTPPEK